ncbi:MAG: S9 family peptidase [Gemmatimonadaceae bacterium]|nr:S9 family peptidase [Gloeobacterales cyanobacterium ES-bin-141]
MSNICRLRAVKKVHAAVAAALLLTCGWGAILVPAQAAETRRLITEKDLLKFNWVADPRLSPDGSRVAYVRVSVDEKKDTYSTSVWLVSTSTAEARQLTNGPRDNSPRWSPDGKSLVFLRSGEKDGKPEPPQVHLLSLEGGEPRPLTDLPKGAGGPIWSPNGKRLAFTSSTTDKDIAEQAEQAKQKGDKPKPSDVRVVKKAVYRLDNVGYLEDKPEHIWTVELPAGPSTPVAPAKQITRGEFDETDQIWSADGSRIYFVSDRNRESYYQSFHNDIYSVAVSGGPITRVTSIEGAVQGLSLSPEGKRLAFWGLLNKGPERSYYQPDLFVYSLSGGANPKNLTANYDYDISDGLITDQKPPRGGSGPLPIWSGDGTTILAVAAERGRANLKLVDADNGDVQDFTRGNQEIIGYSATPDTSRVAMTLSTPTSIGDLFLIQDSGSPKQLTRMNEGLFAQLRMSEPEEITYLSFDGKPMQAWVQKPPGFDPKKKYPLILNIHGGPHAAYGYSFMHEFQWMAAKGYVVLYPNPRGSTSYGQEFGNIIQYNYPGDDYKDLMAGVDTLLARGYIDPNRLGVTGGSGGGVLTNWIIGHTDRFRAAVSQRSIADWRDWWYTFDGTMFQPSWFRGAPWQEEADFKARSPITYVEQIKTPLMLIEGEKDMRTPAAAGGEQLFRALKYLKRPVVMVQFPGETHELSRSGKPNHRIERLQHIVGWFDKYLLGKPMPEYDLPAPGPVREVR